jgi:hypothetical protein
MVAQNRIPYRKPPGSNILRFELNEILAWTKAGNNKCLPFLVPATIRTLFDGCNLKERKCHFSNGRIRMEQSAMGTILEIA